MIEILLAAYNNDTTKIKSWLVNHPDPNDRNYCWQAKEVLEYIKTRTCYFLAMPATFFAIGIFSGPLGWYFVAGELLSGAYFVKSCLDSCERLNTLDSTINLLEMAALGESTAVATILIAEGVEPTPRFNQLKSMLVHRNKPFVDACDIAIQKRAELLQTQTDLKRTKNELKVSQQNEQTWAGFFKGLFPNNQPAAVPNPTPNIVPGSAG